MPDSKQKTEPNLQTSFRWVTRQICLDIFYKEHQIADIKNSKSYLQLRRMLQ